MRKVLLTFFIIFITSINVMADNGNISIDDGKETATGININGYTIVYINEIAQKTGYNVSWDAQSKTIYLRNINRRFYQKEKTIKLTAQSPICYVNEQAVELSVGPYIYNGKMVMTLRDFCKCIDADLEWNEDTKISNVNTSMGLNYKMIGIAAGVILLIIMAMDASVRKCPKCKSTKVYEVSRKLLNVQDVYFEDDVIDRTYDTRNQGTVYEWQKRGLANKYRSASYLTVRKVRTKGKRKWYLVTFKCQKCGCEFQEKIHVDEKPEVIKS